MDVKANPDSLSSIRQRIRAVYVETDRDKQLSARLDDLIENAEDCLKGHGTKRRALFIVGNTNSGKTLSLERQFASRPQFQPRVNKHGELYRPLVSMEVPFKPTSKSFAATILREIGGPSKVSGLTEPELDAELKGQLKERGVLYLHFDEGQHMQRSNTSAALQSAQDFLKSFMQIKEWPLHIIVSGVPSLSDLRKGNGEIKSRSIELPYGMIQCPGDEKWIRHGLEVIAVQNCGFALDASLNEDEFADRLCRSCEGAFGTIMEAIKETCIFVAGKGRNVLTIKDFALNYRLVNGCKPSENIFTAKNWQQFAPH